VKKTGALVVSLQLRLAPMYPRGLKTLEYWKKDLSVLETLAKMYYGNEMTGFLDIHTRF